MDAQFLERFKLGLPPEIPGRKIAVAFSGGADSTALLIALKATLPPDAEILAAHCNFHLRDEESDADTRFCETLAHRLGVRFDVRHFPDTAAEAKESGESIEMVCRRLRYSWFSELATQGYWIALGHHRNDNRETVLLNMLRGTGIRGLKGMEPVDQQRRLFRPLLQFTRSEIERFLHSAREQWRTDSTNLVPDVQRNRLRLNILPAIERDFPSGPANLDTSIANLRVDYALFQEQMQLIINRVLDESLGTVDLERLRRCTRYPERVLLEILSPLGANIAQCTDILNIEPRSGYRNFFTPTHHIVANNATLKWQPSDITGTDIAIKGSLEDFAKTGIISVEEVDTREMTWTELLSMMRHTGANGSAWFDADKLDESVSTEGPIVWRQVRNGDIFRPFGMNGRRKLVSDLLTDLHLSPFQKRKIRILANGRGDILWVAPLRQSQLFSVTSSTSRAYRLKLLS